MPVGFVHFLLNKRPCPHSVFFVLAGRWGALGWRAREVRGKKTRHVGFNSHSVSVDLLPQIGYSFALQRLVSVSLSLFLCPPRPPYHFYSNRSLPSLFPLYLARSVSHPEEIRNSDGSWLATVTVLSDLCPFLALHPSLLLLSPQPVFTFPRPPALHLCISVSATTAVVFPSSPEPCRTSFTFCMFVPLLAHIR